MFIPVKEGNVNHGRNTMFFFNILLQTENLGLSKKT